MVNFFEYQRGEISEKVLKAKSTLYISEISSGVYVIEKSRFDSLEVFISSSTVAMYLNNREKVVVKRLDGLSVSNYNFIE